MSLLAQAADAAAGGSTAEAVLFWVFAVLAVGAALAVVTMRNIVHGALMLVLNLLAVAGLFLTLDAAFLSIIQVLVYAGAIMVLFLFVIMLLGVHRDDLLLATDWRSRALATGGAVLLAGALVVGFVGPYTGDAGTCGSGVAPEAGEVACVGFEGQRAEDDEAGVAFLGLRMFTRYTFPFELSALLLTIATIGAVVLARRRDLEPQDTDLPVRPRDDAGVREEEGVDVLGGYEGEMGASPTYGAGREEG